MNWIKTKNNSKINLSDIPTLNINDLREEIKNLNFRPIGFFGQNILGGVKLFVILADDVKGEIYISSSSAAVAIALCPAAVILLDLTHRADHLRLHIHLRLLELLSTVQTRGTARSRSTVF